MDKERDLETKVEKIVLSSPNSLYAEIEVNIETQFQVTLEKDPKR
jgi:hypothetical protein